MNYKEAVEKFHVFLNSINGDITNIKISEDKWSLREILGHLIDSASNNHQRFVRLQFSDLMDFPAYEAEQWIRVQNYNSMNWELIVSLWYNYNCMLINLIEGIESDKLQNVWIKNEEAIPLEEIINHYYKHLEMHIEHFQNRLGELTI